MQLVSRPVATMTNSPHSSSDAAGDTATPSTSFDLLAEPIRRWIWEKKWTALRDIQERAIPAIMHEDRDVIIAAATAGGKTEAAFLPLLSRHVTHPPQVPGFDLLYVSPLKALINDQFRRLDDLCERIEVPVHRWHGDVSASAKARARKKPSGVLLITPESLEAMFVLRGLEVPGLFNALDCVVIDELHAMLDTERGMHLRSLLSRLEIAIQRPVRRIGLSATLGDMHLAASYLRPDTPDEVFVLESETEGQELKLQIRGYVIGPDNDASEETSESSSSDQAQPGELATNRSIATHIFEKLRGTQNLVFAGSRHNVEIYADVLRQMSDNARFPNEFFAHHANLARDHRQFVEERLRLAEQPTTAVCTSTLELGIDIGAVESIAQVGPPFSVASMRQRLGRSGRRAGKPAVMRMYIKEHAVSADMNVLDALRLQLIQSVAMVELLVAGWCEPPRPDALHLSTFVHQILSVIAERGGVRAKALHTILCDQGPFKSVSVDLFVDVLHCLGNPETALIEQSPDGTILLGATGERIVEHYSFYSVFMTPEEYRVVTDGRDLGTLPIEFMLVPGMTIIFSGRRWQVLEVRDRERLIVVSPDATGQPPIFGGDAGDLHDCVAQAMNKVLRTDAVPPYLDAAARELLREGRDAYQRLHINKRALLATSDKETMLFPWRGTIATQSLALALAREGLAATPRQIAVEVSAPLEEVESALRVLAASLPPNPVELASFSRNLMREKFHPYLTQEVLEQDAASSRINDDAVPDMARQLLLGS